MIGSTAHGSGSAPPSGSPQVQHKTAPRGRPPLRVILVDRMPSPASRNALATTAKQIALDTIPFSTDRHAFAKTTKQIALDTIPFSADRHAFAKTTKQIAI
jgi:hypothetical protein